MDNNDQFVQDGSRMPEEMRNQLDVSHRKTLEKFGISYFVLSGTYEERKEEAIRMINLLTVGD